VEFDAFGCGLIAAVGRASLSLDEVVDSAIGFGFDFFGERLDARYQAQIGGYGGYLLVFGFGEFLRF
jgi:hypothetical protein